MHKKKILNKFKKTKNKTNEKNNFKKWEALKLKRLNKKTKRCAYLK